MPATRRPAVLFDLDGTLLDSIELILTSAHYAFEGRDRVPTDAEWLAQVGRPLPDIFRPYARDDADVDALLVRYREYQLPNHDRLVRAYDGVVETVRGLRADGFPLGVVTSKTEVLAQRGIDCVGIGDCFDTLVGFGTTERSKPDPQPVLHALEQLDRRPSEGVFVGDSVHDIAAGNAAGVTTVAALWGPFSRADLTPSRPRHFLDRIADLPQLLATMSTGGSRGST